mgnify:CR=1 FL=1
MNLLKKTAKTAFAVALAAAVALPAGLSASALDYTIDPKDGYSGTPDSITILLTTPSARPFITETWTIPPPSM